MLGLGLASSLLQLFVHWELVGLASYLLIGFWFDRPAAAAAAKKAFIVTRFGDFAFLIAVLLIWTKTGLFDIAAINALALDHSQFRLDPADDHLCDFVLNREDIVEIAVIALGPYVVAGCSVDKLRSYA